MFFLSKIKTTEGGGAGDDPSESENEWCRKIVVFSRAIKHDNVPGRSGRNLVKSQFSIEIFV